MIRIKIEIDMPPAVGTPVNRDLWRKLKLPKGWVKQAMFDHHEHVGFKIKLDNAEQLKEFGEQVAQLESMLLLIRNT